jgi:hypothetical protein
LDEYQKTDAILLSHVMAALSMYDPTHQTTEKEKLRGLEDFSSLPPSETFIDLLPSSDTVTLPVASGSSPLSQDIYSRFKNNNFVLHSHLNPGYAHGVFPLASRFLNHSCTPNAAPLFVLREGHLPSMEIVALQDIALGEEVCEFDGMVS